MKYFTPHFRITMALLLALLCLAMWSPSFAAPATPQVFHVLDKEFHADGSVTIKVWTNLKRVRLNGELFRFRKVGEQSIRLAKATPLVLVDP